MLLGYDYLPPSNFPSLGPPHHPISSLNPRKLAEWEEQLKDKGNAPSDIQKALERRFRAFGNGNERWDPSSTQYLPCTWISNKADRKLIRHTLLQDINDLVSLADLVVCH
jgi:hypothetical protein